MRPLARLARSPRSPIVAVHVAIALALLATWAPAHAAPRDGRWAIDAVCVPVGCFPGDAPGFPVEITAPGSYVLTSDLDIFAEPSAELVTAIYVTSAAVDLDLGGFTLRGPVACSGQPLACNFASGNGVGVRAPGGTSSLRIHDGAITGFGAYGVQLAGDFPALDRLRIIQNRVTAVLASGLGVRLSEIVVNRNGGAGIFVSGPGASVRDSSISDNGGSGIQTGAAGAVESCLVTTVPSSSNALTVGFGSRVGGSIVTGGSSGITSTGGSLVLGNFSAYSQSYQLDLGSGSGRTAAWLFNVSNQFATGGLSLGQNLCDTSGC